MMMAMMTIVVQLHAELKPEERSGQCQDGRGLSERRRVLGTGMRWEEGSSTTTMMRAAALWQRRKDSRAVKEVWSRGHGFGP